MSLHHQAIVTHYLSFAFCTFVKNILQVNHSRIPSLYGNGTVYGTTIHLVDAIVMMQFCWYYYTGTRSLRDDISCAALLLSMPLMIRGRLALRDPSGMQCKR
jgi:hypothetical protein